MCRVGGHLTDLSMNKSQHFKDSCQPWNDEEHRSHSSMLRTLGPDGWDKTLSPRGQEESLLQEWRNVAGLAHTRHCIPAN